ncbi:MAG: hypothetical protein AVDCRST_MAG73-670, partial [uncultured Thermomicrobiales bacterium]
DRSSRAGPCQNRRPDRHRRRRSAPVGDPGRRTAGLGPARIRTRPPPPAGGRGQRVLDARRRPLLHRRRWQRPDPSGLTGIGPGIAPGVVGRGSGRPNPDQPDRQRPEVLARPGTGAHLRRTRRRRRANRGRRRRTRFDHGRTGGPVQAVRPRPRHRPGRPRPRAWSPRQPSPGRAPRRPALARQRARWRHHRRAGTPARRRAGRPAL